MKTKLVCNNITSCYFTPNRSQIFKISTLSWYPKPYTDRSADYRRLANKVKLYHTAYITLTWSSYNVPRVIKNESSDCAVAAPDFLGHQILSQVTIYFIRIFVKYTVHVPASWFSSTTADEQKKKLVEKILCTAADIHERKRIRVPTKC